MNAPMHQLIAETAINWLGGKAVELWRPCLGVISEASNAPDRYARAAALEKNPAWRDQILIPNHGENVVHSLYSAQDIRGSTPAIVHHWTAEILKSLKAGNLERAAKFAGCLSHVVGDTGQAAHVLDDGLTNKLFPQGDKRFVIHTAIERVTGKITRSTYSPRLLGASPVELNWRLVEELERLKLRSTAELVQIMGALMSDEQAKAEASASRSVTLCAELFADALLTLWAIASGNVADASRKLDLRTLIPARMDSDMLFNFGVMVDRVPGKDMDAALGLDPGLGKEVPGLALLANMSPFFQGIRECSVEYHIPPGVFQRFECLVGLNHKQENQTAAIFEVRLDGHAAFRSDNLGQDDEAVAVRVELGQASTITLHACDVRPAPCDTKFFYPVFATPKLVGRIHRN